MKIRAIEIESEGKVTRYTGDFREEASWPVAEEKRVEVGGERCECGHLQIDHLPECIYAIEGCECAGYTEKA